jgi:hypothetical protein
MVFTVYLIGCFFNFEIGSSLIFMMEKTMPYFTSLKSNAKVPDVMARFPNTTRPLVEYHEALLRGEDSPFTTAQRETMAAYVSGLNHCGY